MSQSMMEAIHPLRQSDVQNGKLYGNRYDMISMLPVEKNPMIAEIGVALGVFSEHMIRTLAPREIHLFDFFDFHEQDSVFGVDPKLHFGSKTHQDFIMGKLNEIPNNTSKAIFYAGNSSENLPQLEDRSMDLIYVDGAHHYDGVVADVSIAKKKIKPYGFMVFNDYVLFDHKGKVEFGIVPVVNELCVIDGWEVVGFAFNKGMYCDIALRAKVD